MWENVLLLMRNDEIEPEKLENLVKIVVSDVENALQEENVVNLENFVEILSKDVEIVKNVGWDLLNVVCGYMVDVNVSERTRELVQDVVESIVTNGNAREIHLAIMERMTILDDFEVEDKVHLDCFCLLSRGLLKLVERMPKERRGKFVKSTVESIMKGIPVLSSWLGKLDTDSNDILVEPLLQLFVDTHHFIKANVVDELDSIEVYFLSHYFGNCVSRMPLNLSIMNQRHLINLVKQLNVYTIENSPLQHTINQTPPVNPHTELYMNHVSKFHWTWEMIEDWHATLLLQESDSMPFALDTVPIALLLSKQHHNLDTISKQGVHIALQLATTPEDAELGHKALLIASHLLFSDVSKEEKFSLLHCLIDYLAVSPDAYLRSSCFYLIDTFFNICIPPTERLGLIIAMIQEHSTSASIVAALTILKENMHFYRHEKSVFSSPSVLSLVQPEVFNLSSSLYPFSIYQKTSVALIELQAILSHGINLCYYMLLSEKSDIWGIWDYTDKIIAEFVKPLQEKINQALQEADLDQETLLSLNLMDLSLSRVTDKIKQGR